MRVYIDYIRVTKLILYSANFLKASKLEVRLPAAPLLVSVSLLKKSENQSENKRSGYKIIYKIYI